MTFIARIKNAAQGLLDALRTEANFRIDVVCALLAIAASIIFRIDSLGWVLVLAAITLVVVSELINTAFERTIDLTMHYAEGDSKHFHDLAKQGKDIAASAPLIASIAALGVAAYVFPPRIVAFFSGAWGVSADQLVGFFSTMFVLMYFIIWWVMHPLEK